MKLNKLILCFIPSNACNLKCKYCFISHVDDWSRTDIEFKYPVDHMIKALSSKRLGGPCYINLTSQGETLAYKDIIQLTKGLLEEGHYVEIITNCLITKRLDELLMMPKELLKHLFFKCSYHYQQLLEKDLTNTFWSNIEKIKKSPCSFTIELMPNDEIVSDIDKIHEECMKNVGNDCHLTVGRDDKDKNKGLLTDFSKEEYVNLWSKFNSQMFKLKMELFQKKRREFCYAGLWSLLIDMASGEASQCYGRINTQNIFKDISKPIKFYPVGHSCMQPFCFNGHAHIAWGIIPEYNAPSYFEIRNRESKDGNWVKDSCKELFQQKFKENNPEYSKAKKIIHTIVNPFYLFIKMFHDVKGLKRKTIKYLKIIFHRFN